MASQITAKLTLIMRMCRYATTALAFLLAVACSASGRQPAPPGPSDIVATVGTVSITLAQVDQKALQEPASPMALTSVS